MREFNNGLKNLKMSDEKHRYDVLNFNNEISDEEILAKLHDFHLAEERENSFNENPPSAESIRKMYQKRPWEACRITLLLDKSTSKIVGCCRCQFPMQENSQHIAYLYLQILPEFRKKGLGTWLLQIARTEIEKANCNLIITRTFSHIKDGEEFLLKRGAEKFNSRQLNRLYISSLDQQLMQNWINQTDKNRFRILFWESCVPEEYLSRFLEVSWCMSDAPRGNLEIEHHKISVEEWRNLEQFWQQHNLWITATEEISTGLLCGYTFTFWDTSNPSCLNQGDTVVHRNFRGNGLGRWLKADMILRVLSNRPEVKYVTTGNANANAPMLKINHEMGFRLYQQKDEWKMFKI